MLRSVQVSTHSIALIGSANNEGKGKNGSAALYASYDCVDSADKSELRRYPEKERYGEGEAAHSRRCVFPLLDLLRVFGEVGLCEGSEQYKE